MLNIETGDIVFLQSFMGIMSVQVGVIKTDASLFGDEVGTVYTGHVLTSPNPLAPAGKTVVKFTQVAVIDVVKMAGKGVQI